MLVLYWYNPINKNQLKIQYVFEIERNKKNPFSRKIRFLHSSTYSSRPPLKLGRTWAWYGPRQRPTVPRPVLRPHFPSVGPARRASVVQYGVDNKQFSGNR
jgi:hypothetical protein